MTKFTMDNTAGHSQNWLDLMNRAFDAKIARYSGDDQADKTVRDHVAEQVEIEFGMAEESSLMEKVYVRCIDLKTLEKAIVDVARHLCGDDADIPWAAEKLCETADAICELLGHGDVIYVEGKSPLQRLSLPNDAALL